jgi:uncharacterized protein with PIN domain
LVAFLRIGGHDVLYVAEAAAGLSDSDVIALALREKRLLLMREFCVDPTKFIEAAIDE